MFDDDIAQAIEQKKAGFAALNLSTGRLLQANEASTFGTASVIKIAIALALFRKAEKNEVDIHVPLEIASDDVFDVGLDDCGMLKFFTPGSRLSLFNACALMLSVSDNTATNFLLRAIPMDEVNSVLSELKFETTRLTLSHLSTRQLYEPGNTLGISTPGETLHLLKGIASHEFLAESNSVILLRMMSAQHMNSKIPRLLPSIRNVPADRAIVIDVFSKGGEISSSLINADAAVIKMRDGMTLLISIYTQGITDATHPWKTASSEHVSTKMIARLSLSLFRELIT
jgi:beta-lactamase class A